MGSAGWSFSDEAFRAAPGGQDPAENGTGRPDTLSAAMGPWGGKVVRGRQHPACSGGYGGGSACLLGTRSGAARHSPEIRIPQSHATSSARAQEDATNSTGCVVAPKRDHDRCLDASNRWIGFFTNAAAEILNRYNTHKTSWP